jgi:hypothetical protein
MGMNYYVLIPNIEQKLHIGKSSCGWTFSFRGYRNLGEFQGIIICEEDWKRVLSNKKVKIIDEEDRIVTYNDFWDVVDCKRNEKLNHAKLTLERSPEIFSTGYISQEYINQNWIDSHENSFTGGEFC